MIDSKKRFSKTAKSYDDYRPSYPHELIRWILDTSKIKAGSTIIDIGCGTGISTRLFSNRGFNLIGIDPNNEMLAVARKKGGATFHKGEAAKTGLTANFADMIVAGQAFHWFDLKPTFIEFERILKPEKWCFAFWNIRQDTKLLKDYDNLIQQYSKDYSKTPKPKQNIEKIKKSKQVKLIKESKFSNQQKFNLDGLIGRAYSSSYIAHGVKESDIFKEKLEKLFNKYEENGQVTFDYVTYTIGWKFI